MDKKIDVVGVAEKRELSRLLERQYDQAIAEAVNLEKELCGKAEAAAARKLGVALIMQEIAKLDRQKEILVDRIRNLGFDWNHGTPRIATTWNPDTDGSAWKRGTDAAKEAMKVLEGTTNLKELRAEKVSVLKKLWLSTSRHEVKKIVGNGRIRVTLAEVPRAPQLTPSKN